MADITYKHGAALSVGYSGAAKIFSFISSLILAFLFGASAKMDIYFYIILASALLNGWLQAINSTVIIPQFIHLKHQDNKSAITFANFFLYCLLAISLTILLIFYFMPAQGLSAISNFPFNQILEYKHLSFLGAAYFTSFLLMGYLIYLAESYKLFSIYKLSILNSVLPLLLLIIFRNVEAMLAGYISAYLIQAFACLFLLRKHAGWYFNFAKPEFDKKFVKNFWAYQPNNLIWSALAYAPLFLISSASAGVVSTLNYARMISDTPIDVFVSKINNVARIKLTTEAACGDNDSLAKTFLRTDKILLFILVPVCVFTSVYAYEIVKLLFMRGSFDEQAALSTAYFLKLLIIVIPFICLATSFASTQSALRIVRQTVIRYSALALFFIGAYIYTIGNWGPYTYPWIFLVLYFAITLFNAVTARQYMPFINYRKHLLYAAKVFLLSFLCVLITKNLFAWYQGGVFFAILIQGSFFVLLNGLLLWVTGTLKDFMSAVNVDFKQFLPKKVQ